ncbi:50S ribosomal protein L15 [Dehalogenimonas etheniformans]|uniref:Large ribosomal subunit protein uL15 n=1 Tax=Dehalogenimonas etheniformans TaxID=1536648 RepID=A0A2P5P7L2_9CHLR|nr:50S ribosomal protein L15 [Dehalogenimonas etheniformans]PPD58274.1 50S ribosomal protein L15 [Dehalogenimonas etheniformans]QNT75683.1 50S ribosomal protein L15 [Dehalogenimonas etheniformans]
MKEHELMPSAGAAKSRKRVGRGDASGHGSYSGRGMKGQKARAGGRVRPGFEGGQNPLIKKLPQKRGFVNPFRVEYDVVNVAELNHFEAGTVVTPELLVSAKVLKSAAKPVKVLADGEVDRALTVRANAFSIEAKAKIEAAGGKVEEI